MATTFATALLRPALEVVVKLDGLFKAKDAPHPALAGLPEVVVPLMSKALQAVGWWQTMTPPLDGWSLVDVNRGMDRLRELRFSVETEIGELLKLHAKDERFPAEMLHRVRQAHQLNDQQRFAATVHDCLAALAAWKPKPKPKPKRKQGGDAKSKYSDEFLKWVEDDWRGARSANISKKEWAPEFAPRAAAKLNITIPRGGGFKFADKLLDTAQARRRRRAGKD